MADSLCQAYAQPLTAMLRSAAEDRPAGLLSNRLRKCVVQEMFARVPGKDEFVGGAEATQLVSALKSDLKQDPKQLEPTAARQVMDTLFARRTTLHRLGAVQNLLVAMQVYCEEPLPRRTERRL